MAAHSKSADGAQRVEGRLIKYRAVVFDLWGTLVDELTYPEANRLVYRQKVDETADLLGLDRDAFADAWAAGAEERVVGAFSTEGALLHICRELGVEPDASRVRAGVDVRYEYVRGALSPRPGTVGTLSTLRALGYRVGLISNCSEEVSVLWDSTPFAPLMDTAVLSYDARLAKPDPRIYEMVVEGLGVAAEECLYVGDGTSNELSGASKAGMTAVLMRAPYDQADGARENWQGERISEIPEVLGLLDRQ